LFFRYFKWRKSAQMTSKTLFLCAKHFFRRQIYWDQASSNLKGKYGKLSDQKFFSG
jgi:hypothetical protein